MYITDEKLRQYTSQAYDRGYENGYNVAMKRCRKMIEKIELRMEELYREMTDGDKRR